MYPNTRKVFPETTPDPGQCHAEPCAGNGVNDGVRQLAACRTRLLCTLPTFETELSGLAVPVIVSDIHQLVVPSGSGTGTKPSAVTQPRPACPRFWYEAWYWLGLGEALAADLGGRRRRWRRG